MAIRFAILGLLAEGPLHGYAVHALFERRLGDFCELNYGQVYQVLTALERHGLVLAVEDRVGRRPLRKVYSITGSGREALDRWLCEARVRSRPFRDDLFIRLFFAVRSRPEQVERLLAEQLAATGEEVAGLRQRRTSLSAGGAGELVRRLFVEAALLRAEATARSIEASRAALRAALDAGAAKAPVADGVAEGTRARPRAARYARRR